MSSRPVVLEKGMSYAVNQHSAIELVVDHGQRGCLLQSSVASDNNTCSANLREDSDREDDHFRM